MSSPYEAQIEGVLHAVAIHPPTAFSWFGRRIDFLPPRARRAMTEETARSYLVFNLRHQLYAEFYCRGVATPTAERPEPQGLGDHMFVEQLAAVNCGRGSWQSGWRVRAVDGDQIVVQQHGLDIWARREECLAEEGGLDTGATVKVRFPNELRKMSPGFYMALGDEDFERSEPVVRLYWHLTADAAVPFVDAATRALNAARIPFRLKVVNDPIRFTRCDAGVVYVAKPSFEQAARALAPVHAQVAPALRPTPPALTKRLAPGLSLGEDPPDGDSFGLHRCLLVAEGLVRAAETGAVTLEDRLACIADRFAEEGMDVTRPFLNASATDDYELQ